jgi:hypothetical protein
VTVLAISELDVAFVSVLVALAAAIAGPLAAWLIARGTWQHEREQAHDDRLFQEQKVIYTQAVTSAHRFTVACVTFVSQLRMALQGEDPSEIVAPDLGRVDEITAQTGGARHVRERAFGRGER